MLLVNGDMQEIYSERINKNDIWIHLLSIYIH